MHDNGVISDELSRRRLRRRRVMFAVGPTLLTLGNGVCGFGSITFTAKANGNPSDVSNMFFAGLMILLAMLFDLLDGHVARWTKQASGFGAQLDSLCDVISFGVAPAFLVLRFCDRYHPRVLWLVAVLYMICVLLRLARYNVQKTVEDSQMFTGLPSPAAAGTVASMAVAMPGLLQLTSYQMSEVKQGVGNWLIDATHVCLPVVMLGVAFLMVSRIRYPHFNQWFHGRRNFHQLAQLIFVVAAICVVHELSVPLVFLWFALASPLKAAYSGTLRRKAVDTAKPAVPAPKLRRRRLVAGRDSLLRRRLRKRTKPQTVMEDGETHGQDQDAGPSE